MQNILLVEDHQFVIDAIAQSFAAQFQIVQAKNGQQMRSAIRRARPQLVVLALELEEASDSLHLLQELVEQKHKVIAISAQPVNNMLRASMYLGAYAYLDKSAGITQLRSTVDAVLQGHYVYPPDLVLRILHDPGEALPNLTKGELKVLEQLMRSPMPSNDEIATNICVSPGRVKNILTALFLKFQVERRQDLLQEARRRGYFPGMHTARLVGFKATSR